MKSTFDVFKLTTLTISLQDVKAFPTYVNSFASEVEAKEEVRILIERSPGRRYVVLEVFA